MVFEKLAASRKVFGIHALLTLAIVLFPWAFAQKPVEVIFLTFIFLMVPFGMLLWATLFPALVRGNKNDLAGFPLLDYVSKVMSFLVGGLFFISGFVKLQDIKGFSYKLIEYWGKFGDIWEVFDADFFVDYSPHMAWFISVFEVAIAFALIFAFRMRITSFLLLLMILFFTALTGFSAISGKVQDCGCFGEAMKLTPWQTFYKDILLTIVILPMVLLSRKIKPLFPGMLPGVLAFGSFILFGLFSIYTAMYLPVIDFLPYKVGANMLQATIHGPWLPKGEEPKAHDYPYQCLNYPPVDTFPGGFSSCCNRPDCNPGYIGGISYGCDSIPLNEFNGNVLLIVIRDIAEAPEDAVLKSIELANSLTGSGIRIYAPTSTGKSGIPEWQAKYKFPYCLATEMIDETVLKTMVRSPLGYILMKNGIILGKWAYRSAPDKDEVMDLLQ